MSRRVGLNRVVEIPPGIKRILAVGRGIAAQETICGHQAALYRTEKLDGPPCKDRTTDIEGTGAGILVVVALLVGFYGQENNHLHQRQAIRFDRTRHRSFVGKYRTRFAFLHYPGLAPGLRRITTICSERVLPLPKADKNEQHYRDRAMAERKKKTYPDKNPLEGDFPDRS